MKLVLFVCTGNSDCSQMAQAFVNIHGAGNVQAFSAGSRPSGKVSPRAIAAMAELGYDLYSHRSKGLDEFNGMTIDYAVTMGCADACPLVWAACKVDWQIPDPRNMEELEFRFVRDLIESKVKALLLEMQGH